MKKIIIPCKFSNLTHDIHFYIGEPKKNNNPIQNQQQWLSSNRGGIVPKEIMQSLDKLHKLSIENHSSFEDLCEYAINSAKINNDSNNSDKFLYAIENITNKKIEDLKKEE